MDPVPLPECITSVDQAAALCLDLAKRHPERNLLTAHLAVQAGEPRRWPVLYLNYLSRPDDDTEAPPTWSLPLVAIDDPGDAALAAAMLGILRPLVMLNPFRLSFGLGRGPGSLIPSWGVPLNPDAEDSPAYTLTLDEALAVGQPDPVSSGIMPKMLARVEKIRTATPPAFKIHFPDTQGPYNLVHMLIGEEAFIAPYTEPEKFRELMERMTTFWLDVRRVLLEAIGDRIYPWYYYHDQLAECSCNMISPDVYIEHVLPHDRRIAEEIGHIAIHPCSGPHVFHMTLDNLPNVVAHEAGFIARTAAGSTSVDEALEAIGARPVILTIGQELPEGEEEAFIRRDLDRAKDNPRLLFGYTGLHWRRRDEDHIRAMHRRLDEYWEAHIRQV